jgi:hypothetical protein
MPGGDGAGDDRQDECHANVQIHSGGAAKNGIRMRPGREYKLDCPRDSEIFADSSKKLIMFDLKNDVIDTLPFGESILDGHLNFNQIV